MIYYYVYFFKIYNIVMLGFLKYEENIIFLMKIHEKKNENSEENGNICVRTCVINVNRSVKQSP